MCTPGRCRMHGRWCHPGIATIWRDDIACEGCDSCRLLALGWTAGSGVMCKSRDKAEMAPFSLTTDGDTVSPSSSCDSPPEKRRRGSQDTLSKPDVTVASAAVLRCADAQLNHLVSSHDVSGRCRIRLCPGVPSPRTPFPQVSQSHTQFLPRRQLHQRPGVAVIPGPVQQCAHCMPYAQGRVRTASSNRQHPCGACLFTLHL